MITVVADSGADQGYGHVSRCAAVVLALQELDVAVEAFALGVSEGFERDGVSWQRGPSVDTLLSRPSQVMLVDTYTMPPATRTALAVGRDLAVLHDEGDAPPEASLVIAVGANSGPDERWLCGPAYACLRPSFRDLPPLPVAKDEQIRILVTTGSGDPGGSASDMAEAISSAGFRVSLLRGPDARISPPPGVELIGPADNMAALLRRFDVVVTAGGQTLLEAAAVGVPTVALGLASNQRENIERMVEAGASLSVCALGDLTSTVEKLASSPGLRERMARAGQQAVDGDGARRVAMRLAEMEHARLSRPLN